MILLSDIDNIIDHHSVIGLFTLIDNQSHSISSFFVSFIVHLFRHINIPLLSLFRLLSCLSSLPSLLSTSCITSPLSPSSIILSILSRYHNPFNCRRTFSSFIILLSLPFVIENIVVRSTNRDHCSNYEDQCIWIDYYNFLLLIHMILKTRHSICFVFSILFTISSIGSSYIE